MLDGLKDVNPSHEKGSCSMTCPSIAFRNQSWDLVLPDVIRPLASSNLGTIIALVHRGGMAWKNVRPSDGALRTEFNGQRMTSTTIRGCSIHLQYTHDIGLAEKTKKKAFDGVLVPSEEADELAFGILPRCQSLGLPDFFFCGSKSRDETADAETGAVMEAMDILGISEATREEYGDYIKRSGLLLAFSDLIGRVVAFMPVRGSSIVRPHSDVHDSTMVWYSGLIVFHSRL